MKQAPLAAAEWAAARGDKWSAQLSGMEATLKPVDDPLMRALRLEQPCSIAEVGCGGGGTTLEIARQAPPGSVVHGFDISPTLVETARRRATTDNAHHVTFEVSDMAHAAPKRPYTRLVSRFGIMFFDEPTAAFANLARWLDPEGRFAFAAWGPVSDNPWFSTVANVVSQRVDLPWPAADAPGPFRYANVDHLIALLRGAGFSAVESHGWRGLLPVGGLATPSQAASFALAAFSSFGDLLAKAGSATLEDARRALTESFADAHHEGAVRLTASVHIVTGART